MTRIRVPLTEFRVARVDRRTRCHLCPRLVPWGALALVHRGHGITCHAACLQALKRTGGAVSVRFDDANVALLDEGEDEPMTMGQREALALMQA